MKVGHTLFLEDQEKPHNATVYRDTAAQTEGALLLTVAIIGGLGNLFTLAVTVTCSRFRTTSSAFLSHHCILDSIKSFFCIPFSCALLLELDIPYCNLLGASYIFLMTLTAYNLLAIHINEEYQLTDWQGYIPGMSAGKQHHMDRKNSFWCVSFGIFMIWFTTILLHLGVAFLPSSAEFSYDIGNCVFNYGTPKNYVIHVLWAMLVTAALLVAVICIACFLCKLRKRLRSNKWSLQHASISRETNPTPGTSKDRSPSQSQHRKLANETVITKGWDNTEEQHYEFDEGADQIATHQMQLRLRRAVVMLVMVISFLVFWYPLFILTIWDVNYTRPPQTYRICMILAWAHPVTTPLFCSIIYFDMINTETLTRSTYSAALPMTDSTSHSPTRYQRDITQCELHHRFKVQDTGFTNDNFPFSNHGSPNPDVYECNLDKLSCACERRFSPYKEGWCTTELQSVSPTLPHRVVSESHGEGFRPACGATDHRHTLIM